MSGEVVVCVGKRSFGISKLPLWHIAMFTMFHNGRRQYRRLPKIGLCQRQGLEDAVGRGGAELRRLLPTASQTAMHCCVGIPPVG